MSGLQIGDYSPGDESRIVQILNTFFGGRGNEDYWRWKYLKRHGFNSQDVVTARVDGKIVGCLHSRVMAIRIEPGLDVLMSFDGDFAVLPEYRGANIGIQVHDRNDQRLVDRGVLLRGGFATPDIHRRFYNKRFGHVFVPTSTSYFRKILSLNPLERKVEMIGTNLLSRSWLRRTLKRYPLKVDFNIDNLPPFHIEFTESCFHFCKGSAPVPDLVINAPYSIIVFLEKGPGQFLNWTVINLLKRRLHIRGLFRKGPNLLAQILISIVKR
ncbi:MAG: GNAT family N-acetyltransferase [Nitrospiria bacterium]